MADRRTIVFSLLVLSFLSIAVYGRHLDTDRDYSTCPPGTTPISIKNDDGFLKLTCIRPRCDEINKVKAVCTEAYTSGCPKGSWVGGIHREFKGANEKTEYKTKCCSHPIFSKAISVKPQPDFLPGAEAKDNAAGQGDIIDIITNVLANSQYDHHNVEVTSVLCHGSSTTRRPTTRKPKSNSKEHETKNNNNGNNGNTGGGGGGGGSTGNNGNNGGSKGNDGGHDGGHGGNDGGHGGSNGGSSHGGSNGGSDHGGSQGGGSHGKGGGSHGGSKGGGSHGGSKGGGSHGGHEECGPTGCHGKLEGGSEQQYSKQNVPPPAKPPASAYDPKAWSITNTGHGGGSGCFSADTLVHTRSGPKRMDEIQVGDEILSSASWDGNSAVSYQPITQFIHKDPTVFTQYTVISTASGRSLSLTPYHLLPQFECHLLERPSVSVREYEVLFTESAKFAKKARTGQCVLVVDTEGKLVAERISNVTSTIRQGVFSPITASGIIVANGVQASCYSSVENHALQHAFFSFMHKVSQYWKPYVDCARRVFSPTPVQDDGQIPYLLRVMLVLTNLVMGSF